MTTYSGNVRMMAALRQLVEATGREYTIECVDGLYELRTPDGGAYAAVEANDMVLRLVKLAIAAKGEGDTMNNTRIFCCGKVVAGEIQWRISPLPVEEQAPVDGELQSAIDYGAELQELIDSREDEDFWRGGNW